MTLGVMVLWRRFGFLAGALSRDNQDGFMKAMEFTEKTLVTVMIGLIALCTVHAADAGDRSRVLRLATTTSTYETGLLDHILPLFEQRQNIKVHVISVGTGKAMAVARAGDVDVILVHARQAEDQFVREGYGSYRRTVMANDFIIAGPADDPAGVKGMRETGAALRRLAGGQHLFVSRGDDSGTHKKESQLWAATGIRPQGKWYLESGQGMSSTLTVADEKNAYVLVDRASYIANSKRLRLHVIVEGDPELLNVYGVIPVSHERRPSVKTMLADALVDWLVSLECQKMIEEFALEGERLFKPASAAETDAGDTDGHAE